MIKLNKSIVKTLKDYGYVLIASRHQIANKFYDIYKNDSWVLRVEITPWNKTVNNIEIYVHEFNSDFENFKYYISGRTCKEVIKALNTLQNNLTK